MSGPEAPPLLVGPKRAARILGVGRGRVYAWIRAGVLPSFRIGREYRVPVVALERFAERIANGEEP